MSEPRRPIRDREVLELFRDEPELLAIVDAIAATQRGRRRLPARRLLIAAALAAMVLLALVPWRFGDPSLTERAQAAVGGGRVLHMVASRPEPGRTVIDLASGAERHGVVELETWFDSETGELRTITRRDGERVADSLERDSGVGLPSDAALRPDSVLRFARGYRVALERDELQVLRRTRLDGSEVLWTRLALPGGREEEVALDADSFLPRAFRLLVGAEEDAPLWGVEAIDSRPRSEQDFRARTDPLAPTGGQIEAERPVSLSRAAGVLVGAVWPGPEVADLPLESLTAQELSRATAADQRERRFGLELVYGDPGSVFVQIRQAREPEPAYGFVEGRLTFDFAPIPEPGALVLTSLGSADRGLWLGQLRAGNVYVTIQGTQRELILAAARELSPLG